METIFRDERVPRVEIRWAGGPTYNIWRAGPTPQGYHGEGGWWKHDCFTRYGVEQDKPTPAEAQQAAIDHFEDMAKELAQLGLAGE